MKVYHDVISKAFGLSLHQLLHCSFMTTKCHLFTEMLPKKSEVTPSANPRPPPGYLEMDGEDPDEVLMNPMWDDEELPESCEADAP